MNKKDILNLIENNKEVKYTNKFFSVTNAKLKKNNIVSFDLPQGKTCPFAGECLKFCYAAKGNYRFKNVVNKYEKNLEASKKANFVNEVCDSLKALPNTKFVRVHSSGDYYNKEYIDKWIEIAKANENIVFYSYTKSIILFKNIALPSNFVIIQSEGTKKDNVYLDYQKPFARIFKDKKELKEAINSGKFLNASDNDLNAIKGALLGKNIALIKH